MSLCVMKLKLFFAVLASAVMLAGCSKDVEDEMPEIPSETTPDEDSDVTPEGEEVYVHIGCDSGVFEEVSRSNVYGSDDLFGIQIYMLRTPSDSWDLDKIPYALGVFDDMEKMIFKFQKGAAYRIEMIYYPNAKNIVWKNRDGTYGIPFDDPYMPKPYTLNEPEYDICFPDGPWSGALNLMAHFYQNSKGSFNQDCVRGTTPLYHGILEEVRITDQTNIIVDMVSSLMKVTFNCANFTKGKITAKFECFFENDFTFSPGEEMVVTLQAVMFGGGGDRLTLFYDDEDNQRYLLATKSLAWKPNTNYVFNFNITEREDGSIGIKLPTESDISEEEVEFDQY